MIMGLRCPRCHRFIGPATDFTDLITVTKDHQGSCTGPPKGVPPIDDSQHPEGRVWTDEEMADMDRSGEPSDVPRRE